MLNDHQRYVLVESSFKILLILIVQSNLKYDLGVFIVSIIFYGVIDQYRIIDWIIGRYLETWFTINLR